MSNTWRYKHEHSEMSKSKISKALKKFYANPINERRLQKKYAKQSASLKLTWQNNTVRKMYSDAQKDYMNDLGKDGRSDRLKNWIIAGKKASGKKTENTSIEVALQVALKDAKIKFRLHPTMHGMPDIYFPNVKLCVFCDGEYWHSQPKRIIRDRQVSCSLRKSGYKVLRFKGKTILQRPKYCVARIKQLLFN